MNLSSESQDLMDRLINHYDFSKDKKTLLEQKQFTNTLHIFHNDLIMADRWSSAKKTMLKVKKNIKMYKSGNTLPIWMVSESKYFPEHIRNYILNQYKGFVYYKLEIGNKKINIYFTILKDEDLNEDLFEKYVKKMMLWLKIAYKYAPPNCSNELTVYCFLTHFKKKLPTNIFDVLSEKHCNSAFTTSCQPETEITIYRKEEFLKVFVHETFHALGLDFSTMPLREVHNKIHDIFPVKSDFNIYEAYSEFWASYIHSLICAYHLNKKKEDKKQFYLYADFCLRFEKVFSILQMVKVLDFMGLTYSNLMSNDGISITSRKYLFKEDTNVFAYYIIKNILLYHHIDFVDWCRKNNNHLICFRKNSTNLNYFVDFIKNKHRSKVFAKDIEKIFRLLKKVKCQTAPICHKILTKTMRMTIFELN